MYTSHLGAAACTPGKKPNHQLWYTSSVCGVTGEDRTLVMYMHSLLDRCVRAERRLVPAAPAAAHALRCAVGIPVHLVLSGGGWRRWCGLDAM
jgi:hypothetical protein